MEEEKERTEGEEFREVSGFDLVPLNQAEKELVEERVSEAIKALVFRKTPRKAIRQRTGRGRPTFNYVAVSYIEEQLNLLLGRRWSFEVVREDVYLDLKQISVLGKLTIHLSDGSQIVKTQYGGSEIKTDRETHKRVLSISDDKKAAASDALKKCASLFGIAADVYAGEEAEITKGEAPATKTTPGRYALQSMLKAGEGLGMTEEQIKQACLGRFDKEPEALSVAEAGELASKWSRDKWQKMREARE